MKKYETEVKGLSDDQLKTKLMETSKERFNLRFQKATGQMEKPTRLREVKRLIAWLKTEQSARRNAAGSK